MHIAAGGDLEGLPPPTGLVLPQQRAVPRPGRCTVHPVGVEVAVRPCFCFPRPPTPIVRLSPVSASFPFSKGGVF